MLRITRLPGADRTTHLRAEGRIVAQSAAELDLACRRAPGQGLVLDLARVTFVDAVGTELVRGLAREGATLVGSSSFVRELLGTREAETGDPEEAPLVARLRGGDAAAFEALVRAHGGRLLAVARRMMGGNEADARDVVQDALLQAHRAIASFNGTSRLSTWLHRIVVNAALMKLRSRRRRPEESIDDLLPRFDDDGHRLEASSEWATPGEEAAQRRETRAMVRRLIDRLPESYRTVLLMRDIEDLDTEEVAEALGITANAVNVRLHRARQALKALVERELGVGRTGVPTAVAS
ncbi:MAG TPA: sigma-70 family RNA polymerase sigma factor [Candidatus Eisenbacteria bacterium]|nr:sigma-70 family RNA polymerase sigma factor [Candidatus Eisenbacteria bacterium]